MKVIIGADHTGMEYKDKLALALQQAGHEVIDQGNAHLDPNDDFTEFAAKVAQQLLIANDPETRGILLSGSGQGMCMAANRFKGIRASLCWNASAARTARTNENSNVLCLSATYLSLEEAGSVMATWLATPYEETPEMARRIQQLDNLLA